MEWIRDYWYVVLLGLVAMMFLFGHRTGRKTGTELHEQHGESQNNDKSHQGRGCCH